MNLNARPILSALLRNRTGALLVALQIALALAILVNAAYLVKQKLDAIHSPSGIDEANLFPLKSRTAEAYASPDELMNGAYTINMANKAKDECVVLVRQTAPLPFTMLAIAQDPEIYG